MALIFPDLIFSAVAPRLPALGVLGVALGLFLLLPADLAVIDLHIGLASLIYHAATQPCEELAPRRYLLPPWRF